MKSRGLKLLSVIITLVVVLGLFAGCGSSAQPTNNQTTSSQPADTKPADTKPADTKPASTNAVADAANAYFANMPADSYKISEKDLIAKVKANENMLILDIRTADVYAKGHVKGAVNLPWGTAISDNLDKLPKDKPIMVYCYTGQTAGQTVALLNVAGFNAKSVNLGWDLGLSKAEGIADVTETTENKLPDGPSANVNPDIKTAIANYYKGLGEIKDARFKNYKVSEDEAKKILDAKDAGFVFLSVRAAKDYAAGHIEGALNIPFAKDMQKQFNTLPKDKKIIVYCYTGQTAGQTTAILRLLGFDAVSMNGGMGTAGNAPAGWANKGYPVVK